MSLNEGSAIVVAQKYSKLHLKGLINRSEFGVAALRLFLQAPALEWEGLMACYTPEQGELLRGFSDEYFSDNSYSPHPMVFPGITDAEIEAAIKFNRPIWIKLHRWIVQQTGG